LKNYVRRALTNRYGVNRNIRFQNLFAEQFYYGHREILLDYSGLDSDMVFEAIISHGDCYPFEENRIPHEYDLSGKPLLQLEWRSDAELVAKQLGVSNVTSIGAIGAYSLLNQGFKKIDLQKNLIDFCRNFNWPESAISQVKELKEHSSILYFPEHSWVGDVLLHDLTRSNPLFQVNPESITVCLGWGDFTSPHTRRVYERNGWRVECAGISNNSIPMSPLGGRITFLKELFDLISSHEIVVSDQITTGLFYSALLNKPCGIVSEQSESNLHFSHWRNSTDLSSYREKSKLEYGWLWGKKEHYSKIHSDVETLLGIKSIKSPNFFRNEIEHFSLQDWIY